MHAVGFVCAALSNAAAWFYCVTECLAHQSSSCLFVLWTCMSARLQSGTASVWTKKQQAKEAGNLIWPKKQEEELCEQGQVAEQERQVWYLAEVCYEGEVSQVTAVNRLKPLNDIQAIWREETCFLLPTVSFYASSWAQEYNHSVLGHKGKEMVWAKYIKFQKDIYLSSDNRTSVSTHRKDSHMSSQWIWDVEQVSLLVCWRHTLKKWSAWMSARTRWRRPDLCQETPTLHTGKCQRSHRWSWWMDFMDL